MSQSSVDLPLFRVAVHGRRVFWASLAGRGLEWAVVLFGKLCVLFGKSSAVEKRGLPQNRLKMGTSSPSGTGLSRERRSLVWIF